MRKGSNSQPMNAIQENANDSESQTTDKKDVAVLKDVEGDEDDDEDLRRDQEVIELDKVDVTPS